MLTTLSKTESGQSMKLALPASNWVDEVQDCRGKEDRWRKRKREADCQSTLSVGRSRLSLTGWSVVILRKRPCTRKIEAVTSNAELRWTYKPEPFRLQFVGRNWIMEELPTLVGRPRAHCPTAPTSWGLQALENLAFCTSREKRRKERSFDTIQMVKSKLA
jgi:hypothetical protein